MRFETHVTITEWLIEFIIYLRYKYVLFFIIYVYSWKSRNVEVDLKKQYFEQNIQVKNTLIRSDIYKFIQTHIHNFVLNVWKVQVLKKKKFQRLYQTTNINIIRTCV